MSKRAYDTTRRRQSAADSQSRILEVARRLFGEHGVEDVTIARIARESGVSESLIYGLYKSKTGILRELMSRAIFSETYHSVVRELQQESDAIRQLIKTATVARTIYETEASQLGALRGLGMYSATLRDLEKEFEDRRFGLQQSRIERLAELDRLNPSLTIDEARRVLWSLTSRDLYYNLVILSGWTPARYEEWLGETILQVLVKP